MDMNMRTENDRQRATQEFNQMSDYYDKYRPDYPEELVKTIINKANLTVGSKLLEIGAGSGKATAPFADFGFEIVCIEPGADLVEQGKAKFNDNKNIKFIVSRFEDYSEPLEYFDAIISAQAFHWVSQPIGYSKCSTSLKEGGYLALFWQIDLFRDVDLDRELMAIISKYEGFVSCMSEEEYSKRMESITCKIASSGLFSKPEIIHSYLDKTFLAEEYFRYMMTAANFVKKTDKEKQACREELIQLADKYNGIKRRLTFELYLTKKL